MLTWLQRDSLQFPPLAKAMREPNGLLAAGGDLRKYYPLTEEARIEYEAWRQKRGK